MLRAAVVGAGQIARKVYLPVLSAREDVELAVLVEPDEGRRREMNRAYRFGKAVSSVEQISEGQVDCAFLLTPEPVRLAPAEALLQRGLDVLVEKPMAMSLGDAEKMVAAAEKNGRILMVGFNRRFMPVFRKAKEFLAGRQVELCRVFKQGANLIAHTIHVLDVLRFFCGDPVEIQAAGDFEGEKEVLAAALIRFDSGALGIFHTSARVGTRLEVFEAHGAGFSVFVEAPDRTVMHADGKEEAFRPASQTWYTQSEQHYGFTDEVAHFLEAVRSRGTPECAAADAIKSHRLAFDILAAMKEHGRQL